MTLSTEVAAASPAAVNSFPPPLPGSEDHRRFARRECKLRAHLIVMNTWDVNFGLRRDFNVIVRNISRTGICFVFYRQMYPDDCVILDFGDLVRHYKVARCRRLEANCYEIGLRICAVPQ